MLIEINIKGIKMRIFEGESGANGNSFHHSIASMTQPQIPHKLAF